MKISKWINIEQEVDIHLSMEDVATVLSTRSLV